MKIKNWIIKKLGGTIDTNPFAINKSYSARNIRVEAVRSDMLVPQIAEDKYIKQKLIERICDQLLEKDLVKITKYMDQCTGMEKMTAEINVFKRED